MDAHSVRGRRVGEVVRTVVERAAPDELPVVDGLAGIDDATVVARLAQGGPRDERLGFGLEDVAVLVSPVLYIVLDQAVRKIVDNSIDDARKGLPGLLRRVTRRRTPTPPVPGLTAQQVMEIRDQVVALAAERGVPDDKVERVGEAVVEVLSDDTDDDSETTPA